MIAVVSSTLFPGDGPAYGERRSAVAPEERVRQTQASVASLVRAGYPTIFLADNSTGAWPPGTEASLSPARVFRIQGVHEFRNKGLSELFMLLQLLKELPADVALLKLSGRYTLAANISDRLAGADVAARWDPVEGGISTRCYLVRDTSVFHRFLECTLNEVFGYPARIRGPRSFWRIVRNSLRPDADATRYFDPPESIEQAAGRALQRGTFQVRRLDVLGVEGVLGGSGERFRE